MSSPLVSIVICSYNSGEYLVPSLRSALAQTHENIEVLVVDDGSTDGSVDRAIDEVDDPRVRWIRQENTGKPRALNRALSELKGEFYAIQDADDLSDPRRIERLLDAFQRNPDLAAAFSGHDLIIGDRHMAPKMREKSPEQCAADIEAMRMPAHDPTAMYRCSLVAGEEYDAELLLGEGLDYILRVGERHAMHVVGESLYSYRIHPNQITTQDPAKRDALVEQVYRKARERRGLPADAGLREQRASRADNNLAANFIDSVLDQVSRGRRWSAWQTAWACLRLRPLDVQYWKASVYAMSPRYLLQRRGKL